MPYLANETIEDFKLKNHSKTVITRPQDIHINGILSSETDEFLPYIEVSRVGFNRNKTQALVYIGNLDAPRADHGVYYMLKKKEKNGLLFIIKCSGLHKKLSNNSLKPYRSPRRLNARLAGTGRTGAFQSREVYCAREGASSVGLDRTLGRFHNTRVSLKYRRVLCLR